MQAMSDDHRPRSLRRRIAFSSPAAWRISVAPPMRKAFAPQSFGGMPAAVPIALARVLVSDVVHAPPEGDTKKGAVPESVSLTSARRRCQAVYTAS